MCKTKGAKCVGRLTVCWMFVYVIFIALHLKAESFYFYGNIELGVIVVCVIANCWTLYFKIQTSPGKGNC